MAKKHRKKPTESGNSTVGNRKNIQYHNNAKRRKGQVTNIEFINSLETPPLKPIEINSEYNPFYKEK